MNPMNEIAHAMRYASNTFQRFVLAIAASIYTITTAAGPDLTHSRAPQAYQALVLSSGYKWVFAAVFALDAFCLWWRLFDHTPRVKWAIFINIFTATLWTSIALATIATYGSFLPDATGEVVLALISLFSMVRTNKTINDRGTA